MQNARLDEAQVGIKIARRNINNLRIHRWQHPYGRKWRTKELGVLQVHGVRESHRGKHLNWTEYFCSSYVLTICHLFKRSWKDLFQLHFEILLSLRLAFIFFNTLRKLQMAGTWWTLAATRTPELQLWQEEGASLSLEAQRLKNKKKKHMLQYFITSIVILIYKTCFLSLTTLKLFCFPSVWLLCRGCFLYINPA